MPIESATFISQLNAANPSASDPKSEGDDQLRLVKSVLQSQFPALGASAVTATATALSTVGVTQAATDATTNTATTAFVQNAILASSGITATLPGQGGNAGKFLTTNGTSPNWGTVVAPSASNGSSMVLLSTIVASNSATVDVETTFDSTYDQYLLLATGVTCDTDTVFLSARLKVGGAYQTSGYLYHVGSGNDTATTYIGLASSVGAFIRLHNDSLRLPATVAGSSVDVQMSITMPSSTTIKKRVSFRSTLASAQHSENFGFGSANVQTALTGVRFYMSTGNIATGNFRLYGIRNA